MSEAPLLQIEPKELEFIFELKKQSSCSVQLTNNTDHYVAFKVKTTSPKKYSVRPNVGVLAPKATCEFIVTMQAQREAPEDMVCKDKFLIQSTKVHAETTSEDVTSSLFVKDGSKYIEENKLKVTLISPPNSPDLSPINGDFKNGLDHEKVQIYSKDEIQSPEPMIRGHFTNVLKNPDMVHEVLELEEDMELRQEYYMGHTMKHVGDPKEEAGLKVSKNELNMLKDVEELKPQKKLEVEVSEDLDLNKVKNAEEWKPEKAAELKVSKVLDLNKVKNAEELKPEKAAELKVSKVLDLNKVKNAEELKPEKAAELKVSKVLDLNKVKNAEELKPEKAAELKVSKVLDLNKVKNIEEQKPEKAADLNMSKVLDLNPVDDVKELKPETETVLKMSKDLELKIVKSVEELKPEKETELKISKDMELETVKNVEELKPENETELKMSKDWEWRTVKNVEELKPEKEAELIVSKSIEEVKLLKAIEEMKLKLDGLESKLNEVRHAAILLLQGPRLLFYTSFCMYRFAIYGMIKFHNVSGVTISKLTEERMLSNQETKILQEKLADLINKGPRKVQVGFPLLYVWKKPESVKIIVSSHNLERTPSVEEIGNLAARIQASGADVVKIATTAFDKYVGLFCVLLGLTAKAVLLSTIKELLDLYNFRQIGIGTKVHGAVGNPISDSKSPHLYNATFKSVGFDGVYLPLLVDNVSDFLNTYSSPDFVGYSYTIPPKENGLRCCDEIDPIAKIFLSANDGNLIKLIGYNFDYLGAIAAIEERLHLQGFYVSVYSLQILRKDYTRFQFIHRSSLQLFADSNRRSISGCSPLCGKLFVVMGAGGAGKAIAYGGKEKGARVVVANRIYGEKKIC
ncbi:Vesicle-associated protein 2-2 [Glycine soja]|nr:Vesicle-associated protein 2-2 [Glycine soja]